MVLATAPATRLISAEPSDIDFLASFHAELASIIKDNPGWRRLLPIEGVLSDALGYQDVEEQLHTSGELEPDSDTEDQKWRMDWEVQEILQWMLQAVRATGLPKESLQHLVQQLKRRVGRISITPDMSSGSRSADSGPSGPDLETMDREEPEQHCQSSHIFLLPAELFHNIFESVCSPRYSTLFSPLILSHVNSHFRSIVLVMPSLWSTIDDTFPSPIAKLYLERSIGEPLDIRIGLNGRSALEDGKVTQLFEYLRPHAHRINALKIVTENIITMDDFDEMMECGVPFGSPQKLEYGRYDNPYPANRDLGFTLNEPDSLKELLLWGYQLDNWIDTFPTSLRRLQLGEAYISVDILVAAVERAAGLSVLILQDCILYGEADAAVTAGRLADLQFIRMMSTNMVLFSRLIQTPALASLSVVGPSRTDDTNFLVTLAKSSKEIRSVEICDYSIAGSEWLSIFKHLPNVTHLRVRASYSSDDDLQALTMAQTLPNIKSITLDNELRLTTLLVEQMARTHLKLESIVLRGWDPSNVSSESLTATSKLVKNILVETFKKSPEEDLSEETDCDSSDDSSTEGSWLAGDDYVALRKGY